MNVEPLTASRTSALAQLTVDAPLVTPAPEPARDVPRLYLKSPAAASAHLPGCRSPQTKTPGRGAPGSFILPGLYQARSSRNRDRLLTAVGRRNDDLVACTYTEVHREAAVRPGFHPFELGGG